MSARFLLVLVVVVGVAVAAQSELEQRAVEFLKKFDENATQLMYQYSLASWAYNTNITDENSQKLVSAKHSYSYSKLTWLNSNRSNCDFPSSV